MITEQDIINEIEAIEDQIRNISSEFEKLKKRVPEGARLRAAKHGKSYQYFIKSHGTDTNGKYIKQKDRKTASVLAQIEYDSKLISELCKRIETLKRFQAAFGNPFDNTLDQMVFGKRELIAPHYLADEVYLSKWINQEYTGLSFEEHAAEYYTRKGLRVRSKSEILIADILDDLSIPFLYEKPLHLNSEIVHPDFTLLNIKQRKEMYWEHFGMMDDMDYRNKAFLKIRKYESNGLFRHDSFIWTFETGRFPLDTKAIRKMAKELKTTLGYHT
ncbi:MAG: hypothetical protein IK125_05210 [Lachnospiraceae bacterium]|nr:hypothetical protein [Lachnospiraceae bacterium]